MVPKESFEDNLLFIIFVLTAHAALIMILESSRRVCFCILLLEFYRSSMLPGGLKRSIKATLPSEV